MWQGGLKSFALWSACLACAVALASPAHAEDEIEQARLADGQFHLVHQPAPDTTQTPSPDLQRPTQPPARPRGPSAPQPNAQARSFGGSRGPQSSAPSMIGDFFGGSSLQLFLQAPATPINTSFSGFAFSSNFDNPNAPLLFALNPNGPPILTTGTPGTDASGDGVADTFPVNSVPPQLTPVAPGPGTITFQNGNLVFTRGSGKAADGSPGKPSPPGAQFAPGYQLFLTHLFQPAGQVIDIPFPGGGGGVGRVKISENNSPIPRDRVFHNFSYFDNVPLTPNGVNVSRFMPGFEKTFFDGVSSVEVRIPFASTLDNVVLSDAPGDMHDVQFGNINIPLKVLIYQNQTIALAGGMAFTLPTASDTIVQTSSGTQLARIDNDSVHWMPFVGLLLTPNDRFFSQAFLQYDIDGNGYPIQVTNFAGGLAPVGRIDDATYLYADWSMGYWLRRDNTGSGLTGLAPTFELHYNTSMGDTPSLQSGAVRVSQLGGSVDILNLVVGTMFEWNQNTTLTLGYATPLSDAHNQDFNGELRVIFNHRFGPQTRASRAQF